MLVMEYVSGGTLAELLEKTPQLPLKQALHISIELADALSRAHHLDIIHRDIKPSNVLLGEDGTPKLSDFGIAYLTDQKTRLTQDNSLLGTIQYMSPEAISGEEVNGRTDMWSFGIMLFEMLSGRLPFLSDSMAATLTSILNEPLPDLTALRPETPDRLIKLIKKMLIKEQDKRQITARQLAAELELIHHSIAHPADL